MAIALNRLLLHAVPPVGVRVEPYEPELACAVASLQNLSEDVEHASGVAANGVVAVLPLVAFHYVSAPFPVDGEVYTGVAALSFTAEVDHDFALEGNARFGEKACYALLLLLLTLPTPGGVDGALVDAQIAPLREARPTFFADMRLLSRVGARVRNQLAILREARVTVRAGIRPFSRMDALVIDQGASPSKACPTNIAAERLISGVCTLVAV